MDVLSQGRLRGLIDWEAFVRALLIRFKPSVYDNSMEALTRFRQLGSIEEYKALFEALSNQLRGLSNVYKLLCFLSGLKDEIYLPRKMFNITTCGNQQKWYSDSPTS